MSNLIDLTGQRFGSLVVIQLSRESHEHQAALARWECRCDCGAIVAKVGRSLRVGETKTCGTAQHRAMSMIGKRFGRLIVLREAGRDKRSAVLWSCRCDCSTEIIANGTQLKRGRKRSCGCFARDKAGSRVRTHGMTDSPTYTSWSAMIARCIYPKCNGYKNYGGRGITVCERWRTFANFLADMGERPEGHTLDRIDSNGNYEPGNCQWSTVSAQHMNRRSSRAIEWNGQKKPLFHWAKETGISRHIIGKRLKDGWSVEAALTTPV